MLDVNKNGKIYKTLKIAKTLKKQNLKYTKKINFGMRLLSFAHCEFFDRVSGVRSVTSKHDAT